MAYTLKPLKNSACRPFVPAKERFQYMHISHYTSLDELDSSTRRRFLCISDQALSVSHPLMAEISRRQKIADRYFHASLEAPSEILSQRYRDMYLEACQMWGIEA